MKLSNLILKAIFFTALISVFFAFIINSLFEYNNFLNENTQIKRDFIELKKSELKVEVQKVYDYIDYHKDNIDIKAKETLRNRVTDAYKIAYKIYNTNKNKKTKKEIENLIITTLQNISYEKNTYFFINTNEGQALLYNRKDYLDNYKNIWNLKDDRGVYYIRKQSNLALTKKEAFVYNHFKKEDAFDKKEDTKLAFIKLFEPYNWHIGMSFYLDDLAKETQKDILQYISTIRFGKDGYIFVNSINKKSLVTDGRVSNPPMLFQNESLFKQELNAIKNINGDFIFYNFKKLNTTDEYPKMSFIKEYPDWQWIIGAGTYIDGLNTELLKHSQQLKHTILRRVSITITIFFILLIFIFLLSKKITSYIDSNILYLIKSFKVASSKLEKIDISKFTFKEFKTIAKKLNKTLKLRNKAEKRINHLLDIINKNVIISTTNEKGIITEVNDFFCEVSGYTKEELIGKSHNIIRHPDMQKEVFAKMWKSLLAGIKWEGEIKNKKKNGETYWVKATIHPNFNKGKIVGYTAIRQDITDKKRVEYLSITDELTQTYNRRYFNLKIEEEINRAKRNNYYLGFIMLDIDHFKLYNDNYGHQAGDKALTKVAEVLIKHTCRASDFTFRLGGEEFGILFSYKTQEESLNYANLIKEEIENLEIEHSLNSVSSYLTISVGLVVQKGENIENANILYKRADEALYKAKETGRNKVCVSE